MDAMTDEAELLPSAKAAMVYQLLLAESHLNAASVWVDAPADLGCPCRLADGRWPQETVWAKSGRNAGEVSEKYGRPRVHRSEFRSPWRAS